MKTGPLSLGAGTVIHGVTEKQDPWREVGRVRVLWRGKVG